MIVLLLLNIRSYNKRNFNYCTINNYWILIVSGADSDDVLVKKGLFNFDAQKLGTTTISSEYFRTVFILEDELVHN